MMKMPSILRLTNASHGPPKDHHLTPILTSG